MFSSGTTGAPKCIVQGPGVALNHAKEGALHWDLRPGDKSLWYTTTGWMMWNWLLGASLTTGGAAVLVDGDATYCPKTGSKGATGALWDVAETAGVALLGGSARYFGACAAEDLKLPPLAPLRSVGSTGSPCPPSAYAWLRDARPGVGLYSTSGGTDLNGSFNGGNPWLPVYSGELQSAGLGLDVAVLDEYGDVPVETGAQGELACRTAFPCAPLRFLGDDDAGSKYRSSYFDEDFADGEVWKHGDWAEPTAAGGLTIHGRSDATLNPGGVRIGTAEIYNSIEPLLKESPAYADSLVSAQPFVFTQGGSEVSDVRVVLFVQTADAGAAASLEAAAAAAAAPRLVSTPTRVDVVAARLGPFSGRGRHRRGVCGVRRRRRRRLQRRRGGAFRVRGVLRRAPFPDAGRVIRRTRPATLSTHLPPRLFAGFTFGKGQRRQAVMPRVPTAVVEHHEVTVVIRRPEAVVRTRRRGPMRRDRGGRRLGHLESPTPGRRGVHRPALGRHVGAPRRGRKRKDVVRRARQPGERVGGVPREGGPR
mmetsp:Transcript_23818/g.71678  ORF Transcript_23818/g.71678 Transcript_23818/m.71678 type:complete len:535 (-) Transcript_23818:551-2155(-)